MKEVVRYMSAVAAAAVYRPGIVGMAGVLPFDLGIASYVLDLEALRGLDSFKAADADLRARLDELHTEAAGRAFTVAQREEFEQISGPTGLLAQVTATIEELEIREETIRDVVGKGGRGVEAQSPRLSAPNIRKTPDDIFDLKAYRDRVRDIEDLPVAMRDGAMRAIEQMSFAGMPNANAQRDRLAFLVDKHRDEDNGWVSRRILGTCSPLYIEAYTAAMARRPLTQRMQAVLQSYSDADGGYALPSLVDPTFVLTSDGSVNPLRQPGWARVETITGKDWAPVTTAGVTAAYVGERTSTGASGGAPADVAKPTATPVRADINVPITMEYLADYGAASILAEINRIIQFAKDDLEADKFFLGDGSGEPDGIIAAIVTETNSLVTTITNDVYALADIDKLILALPARFRARAKMCANLGILQASRAFATAAQPGNTIYDPISKTLRGYESAEATAMDSVATDGKKILLMGDFSNFVIVDRLGMTSRLLDAYDGSGNPTGNTNLYAAWRNTAKPITVKAFRLLKVQ